MAQAQGPRLGTQTPRLVSTRPAVNPFTPPIPQPSQDVRNLVACVAALKACVESLIGQRGDASNRAVTFRDLVNYGVLDSAAVQSPNGVANIGGGVTTGSDKPLTHDDITDWDENVGLL